MKVREDIFGWFDNPLDEEPRHDPGVENGLCLVCTQKLNFPLKTICLALYDSAEKSYFFRVHKGCWDGLTEKEKSEYECSLIDNL